jgi:hypothetical protein
MLSNRLFGRGTSLLWLATITYLRRTESRGPKKEGTYYQVLWTWMVGQGSGALPVTARRAKRENGGLGEDPPGSTITYLRRTERWGGGLAPQKRTSYEEDQGIARGFF